MGYFAAMNIHQLMLARLSPDKSYVPRFLELPVFPPLIALAVGKQAVSYSPEQGTVSGEDLMKAFFGDDLGFSST